ncbi:MAG: hypothetical protein GY727_11640, partial [Gammaproteobacteria bacterium]|nr:hypothetical protein [Gammaproteobacteria bacterium]
PQAQRHYYPCSQNKPATQHISNLLGDEPWARRIKGIRCNASRLSHTELDECEVLDAGNPDELADQYSEMLVKMPWMNIFGACCGSDLRHVSKIAKRLANDTCT